MIMNCITLPQTLEASKANIQQMLATAEASEDDDEDDDEEEEAEEGAEARAPFWHPGDTSGG